MFRNGLAPWHILVLVIVMIVLFGYKRLPDMTRSVGRSMRIFKSEINEMKADGKDSSGSGSTVAGEARETTRETTRETRETTRDADGTVRDEVRTETERH